MVPIACTNHVLGKVNAAAVWSYRRSYIARFGAFECFQTPAPEKLSAAPPRTSKDARYREGSIALQPKRAFHALCVGIRQTWRDQHIRKFPDSFEPDVLCICNRAEQGQSYYPQITPTVARAPTEAVLLHVKVVLQEHPSQRYG